MVVGLISTIDNLRNPRHPAVRSGVFYALTVENGRFERTVSVILLSGDSLGFRLRS
jgi:hypothetical protein